MAYTPDTQPTSLDELKKPELRWMERFALNQKLGLGAPKVERKLANRGITDETMRSLFSQITPEQMTQPLERMGKTGAEGAANAALGFAKLAGANAKSTVTDQFNLAGDQMRQQLQGLLGGTVDPNSASYQAVAAQFGQDRADELSRTLREIDWQTMNNVSNAVQQIGAIVEMKKLAREQENLARAASIGNLAGMMMGPFGGAGVGAIFGGTQGAVSGAQSGWQTAGAVASILGTIMGGGGGQGGTILPGNKGMSANGSPVSPGYPQMGRI